MINPTEIQASFFGCYDNEVEGALENLTPPLRFTALISGCLLMAVTPPIYVMEQVVVRPYRYLSGSLIDLNQATSSHACATILIGIAFFKSAKNQ